MKLKLAALSVCAPLLIAGCGGGSEIANADSPPPKHLKASVPQYNPDHLYQFFAVAFNAAPGVTYMGQLLEAANYGLTIKEIVNIFTTKSQFTDVYPLTFSNTEFATKLVNNVVGSSASAQAKQSAVNDIVSALALPSWTRGDVIFAIFSNLAGKPSTDPDWAGTSKQMANQVAYAKYYTEVMKGDSTAIDTLKKVIRSVTATTDIVSGIELAILSDLNKIPFERFQAISNGTVLDTLTGLTWMRCALGQVWTGSSCTGDAATYVQAEIPELSNDFKYAGISNWRVPSIRELQSIVNLSRFNPSTDPYAFPNTPFQHFRTSNGEWTIGFGNTGTTRALPSAFLPVRLVTSSTDLTLPLMRLNRPSEDFFDNLDGTVIQMATGLMWQKCMKGQTYSSVGNNCKGIAREYLPSQVANEALAGYNDWRVPTIEEWINFADYTKRRPAINSTLFLGTPLLTYDTYLMSSSVYAPYPSVIWTFGSSDGEIQIGIKDYGRYVRLVRTIPR